MLTSENLVKIIPNWTHLIMEFLIFDGYFNFKDVFEERKERISRWCNVYGELFLINLYKGAWRKLESVDNLNLSCAVVKLTLKTWKLLTFLWITICFQISKKLKSRYFKKCINSFGFNRASVFATANIFLTWLPQEKPNIHISQQQKLV